MKPYVVRQGDYLARLAVLKGFDPDAVWNHERNRDLRGRRASTEVLAPGDILFVPDEPVPDVGLASGGTRQFVVSTPPKTTVMTVYLEDQDGQPLANKPYEITGALPPTSGRTGSDGKVSFTVSVL